MICLHCNERESTGVLVQLCDACFDEWEARVNSNPSNVSIDVVHPVLRRKAAGGLQPEEVTAIEIHETKEAIYLLPITE